MILLDRAPRRAPCSVDGCDRPTRSRGWCSGHYERVLDGSALTDAVPLRSWAIRRGFWPKVDRSGECWEWTAYRLPAGYGQFTSGGRHFRAHRFAYESEVGPVPRGLAVDHLCFNRACVKVYPPLPDGTPDPRNHLEAVTNRENNRRARQRHTPVPGAGRLTRGRRRRPRLMVP